MTAREIDCPVCERIVGVVRVGGSFRIATHDDCPASGQGVTDVTFDPRAARRCDCEREGCAHVAGACCNVAAGTVTVYGHRYAACLLCWPTGDVK